MKAADRRSPPGRLRSRGWIGLVAIVLLLALSLGWAILDRVPRTVGGRGILMPASGFRVAAAPIEGRVDRLHVQAGLAVDADQPLVELRPIGDESRSVVVASPESGRVLESRVGPGDHVAAGTTLVVLEDSGGRPVVTGYIGASDGKRVRPGMDVLVEPSTVAAETHGYIVGTVRSVAGYPSSFESMEATLRNRRLVERLQGEDLPLQVIVDLEIVEGRFRWTIGSGPPTVVENGTICRLKIVVGRERPIDWLIPGASAP